MRPGVRSSRCRGAGRTPVAGRAGGGTNASVVVLRAAATYFLPDDDDYVQPTSRLIEEGCTSKSRFNYEDRDSLSFFAGWNFSAETR